MKHGNFLSRSPLRFVGAVIALALSLLTTAHADEYGDVNQLVRAGKLSEALNKADQYLAAKPRDPQMRFIKGVIQREAGKPTDAITTFTKLTEDYPELPEPYNNLAVLYAAQGQHDKARAALEMAIRTNPSYATAHENLGDIYARLASQAYSKALQIDGGAVSAQPKLALIRELFNPQAKGQRPTAAPPAAPAPAAPPPVQPGTPASATTTPAKPAVVPAPGAVPPAAAPTADTKAAEAAEAAVRAWAKAWAAKDMSNYLGAYGKEFVPPGGLSRSAWESERRKRIVGKSNISLKLEQLTVTVSGNKAVAKFRQDYKADALAVSSRKTIDLVKVGERWLIVRESVGN
jgi:tetratricopeptide (TPR) repeat protein